jgi:hypothetical protein
VERKKIIIIAAIAVSFLAVAKLGGLFMVSLNNYPGSVTGSGETITYTASGYQTQQSQDTYYATLIFNRGSNPQLYDDLFVNGIYSGSVTWSSSKGSITTEASAMLLAGNPVFSFSPTQEQNYIVLYGCEHPSDCAAGQNQQYSTAASFVFAKSPVCVPQMTCSQWTECLGGVQSRTCGDGCGSSWAEDQNCQLDTGPGTPACDTLGLYWYPQEGMNCNQADNGCYSCTSENSLVDYWYVLPALIVALIALLVFRRNRK